MKQGNRSGWTVALLLVGGGLSYCLMTYRRRQARQSNLVSLKKAPAPISTESTTSPRSIPVNIPTTGNTHIHTQSQQVVSSPTERRSTMTEEDLWARLHRFRMVEGSEGEDDGEREEPFSTLTPPVHYRRQRRAPVSGISTNLDESMNFVIERFAKTPEDHQFLVGVLKKCPLFNHWEEAELNVVAEAMQRRTYHKGQCITRQSHHMDFDNDQEGHSLYVVIQGHVSAIVDRMVVKVLRRGMYFGESNVMFLHSSNPVTHRVDDATCTCFVLHSEVYRHISTITSVNKRELYEGFLDRLPWLSGLTHREKLTLADALQPVVYEAGELLIEFGTRGEWMYIILLGEVDVFGRDENGEVIHVCDFTVGDCVGELEFINNHMTVADVRARGRVKAARLSREHFELTMGSIVDVLKRAAQREGKYSYYQGVMAQIN